MRNGVPEFRDWMGIAQGINTVGQIKDRTASRDEKKGIETGLSRINSLPEGADPYKEKVPEGGAVPWGKALVLNHQQGQDQMQEWRDRTQKSQVEAVGFLKDITFARNSGASNEDLMRQVEMFKDAIIPDRSYLVGKKTDKTGKVIRQYEGNDPGDKYEIGDVTVDQAIQAIEHYVTNKWVDISAKGTAERKKANEKELLSGGRLFQKDGQQRTIYRLEDRSQEGNFISYFERDPQTNGFKKVDLKGITGEGWVPTEKKDLAQLKEDHRQLALRKKEMLMQLGIVTTAKDGDGVIIEEGSVPIDEVYAIAQGKDGLKKKIAIRYLQLAVPKMYEQLMQEQADQADQDDPFKIDPGELNDMLPEQQRDTMMPSHKQGIQTNPQTQPTTSQNNDPHQVAINPYEGYENARIEEDWVVASKGGQGRRLFRVETPETSYGTRKYPNQNYPEYLKKLYQVGMISDEDYRAQLTP
jgi:hypothetical protein